MKIKVRVYKKGIEVGWYKDKVPGINAVVATCKNLNMDIKDFEFRAFDDDSEIVWRGIEHELEQHSNSI